MGCRGDSIQTRLSAEAGDSPISCPEGTSMGVYYCRGSLHRGHLPLTGWGKAKEVVGSAVQGTLPYGLVSLLGDQSRGSQFLIGE